MAFSSVVATLAALSFAPASHASLMSLSPSEIIQVSLDGDRDDVGSVDTGSLTGSVVGRERRNAAQLDRRVATFLKFDVSAYSPREIMAATFDTEFVDRLNNNASNVLDILVGVVEPGNTWNDTGMVGTVPLFVWGGTSLNQQTLLGNVSTASLNSLQSIDLLSTVTGWANGSIVNNGIVVFGDRLEFQGAGFASPLLNITIPEPATVALLGLGVAGFGFQRRKRRMA